MSEAAPTESPVDESKNGLRLRAALIVFGVCALALPLCFALYTGNTWEDYFITFRHSKNLVDGHGPVFQPGERTHGFTSPINTMLPALFFWMTGAEDHLPALWLYRLVSLVFFAAGGVLVLWWLRDRRLSMLLASLYFLLSIKATVYASNGQEAGFMLAFLALALVGMCSGHKRAWLITGLAWAGLMYTRPDTPVFVTALGIAGVLFTPNGRKEMFVLLMKAAAVCTVLYLPWFIWAWSYFGSPVPHSAVAKGVAQDPVSLVALIRAFPDILVQTYLPIYHMFGGWPGWLTLMATAMGILPALYWACPVKDPLGRSASLVYALVGLYLAYVNVRGFAYPWYFPPLEFLAGISLASGLPIVVRRWMTEGRHGKILLVVNLVFLGTMLYVYALSWVQIQRQQSIVEDGHRRMIGLWLKDNIEEGDTVFLEPIGYVGYFSEAHILDFPGLVSPSVVESRRKGNDYFGAIVDLKPNWVAMRPWEAKKALAVPEIEAAYSLAMDFDVRGHVNQYAGMPGHAWLLYDARFLLFKRQDSSSSE
jgi:hypothetical protein